MTSLRFAIAVLFGATVMVGLSLAGGPFSPALARPRGAESRPPREEIAFKKIVLDARFRSEGVTVADVNRDGRLDVLAGNLWYEAPRWTPREIAPAQAFDPATTWSNSFQNFAADVDRDGWADQLVIGFPGAPAVWRKNPGKKSDPWRERPVWGSACNESPAFADLLGSGKPVLVFAYDDSRMAWYEPRAARGAGFECHAISEPNAPGTNKFSHGLGVGDLNGDGRADVLVTKGYWTAPKNRRAGRWAFVAADFGPDCAQMHVYDVNADGLMDVLSSSAHNIGLWWHEQRRGPGGAEFVRHEIDASFSQSHALALADINGDGLMDLVTGKRFWAHGPDGDVRPGDPPVLYWFELRRDAGAVTWTRHEIDDDSGVGTQVVVADINGDNLPDVVASNKKGVHVFEQQRTPARAGRTRSSQSI
jgi:hypothetical protein